MLDSATLVHPPPVFAHSSPLNVPCEPKKLVQAFTVWIGLRTPLAKHHKCAGRKSSNTIDANTTIAGNQAFSSALLNSSGTGAAGRIKVYEQGGVATIVEAFVNADSVADFQIQIAGIGLGLTSADFVL